MRHARHTHDAGLAGSWPTLAIWSSAVSGAVLAFAGGGSALTYAGAAVAAGSAVVGGTVIRFRQSACAANAEVIAEARAKDKAEFAAEVERRDLKLTRLDDELAAVRERGVVLRRQLSELRERINDEKLHRIAASEERDRALAWAGSELNRASDTLEATREELQRTLLRAAAAEFELAELERARTSEAPLILPSVSEFAAAGTALATVWADTTEPEVLALALDFDVAEPLGEPYLIPEAVSIPARGGVPTGLRFYRRADDTAEIDLTAYDETTEFSVRQLRHEETARSA